MAKNWTQLEINLDLPKPPQPPIKMDARVRLLPPHPDAGKTGRVSLTPAWLIPNHYCIELRGKSVSAVRHELEQLSTG